MLGAAAVCLTVPTLSRDCSGLGGSLHDACAKLNTDVWQFPPGSGYAIA